MSCWFYRVHCVSCCTYNISCVAPGLSICEEHLDKARHLSFSDGAEEETALAAEGPQSTASNQSDKASQ